jgi:beta-N-acetylhexosaminidase
VAKAVGQLITATYQGELPPESLLDAIRAGEIGAVILMADNTGDSVAVTSVVTHKLQQAARAGGNPELLIMTDQEGGEVKRLAGAPAFPAASMADPAAAAQQGFETALLLRTAGVNVDLAPVSDVTRADGFMTLEQRTFGNSPRAVAQAACAFAAGLERGGVAYTLKHFPGLGDAIDSTDNGPVAIDEPASEVFADDAAYRLCGRGPLALVMVSSASYGQITGDLPAVMSPVTYQQLIPANHISAVTISDAFESGAIARWTTPARRAIAAGLDMVMYASYESDALQVYAELLQDVRNGTLSEARVEQAAGAVLALKRALGLG